MSEILVVGSLNMDLVVDVKNIPNVGETILGNNFSRFAGGKGANQAVAAAKLQEKVTMFGSVGNDANGKFLIEGLKKEGVNTENIILNKNEATGFAFITVDKQANNSIVVVPAANDKLTVEDIDNNINLIKQSKIILLQLEIPMDVVKYVAKIGNQMNKYIILNPAPAQFLEKELLENINLLTPNQSELEVISDMKITQETSIKQCANKLIDMGVKEVIVTLGENGAAYFSDNKSIKFAPRKVEAVDTTGAGDCFNGVLASSLAKGFKINEAIHIAIKASSISVTKKGAQNSFPTLEEIKNMR